ncbi:SAV_915 family protein [Sphaerisporangium sp. B11E5]|uniref:SAV_915 family protein n=1 Tax=Sphaerisporangium sp. B11E5 TaxID=3153563 RepID=UPI00325CD2AE
MSSVPLFVPIRGTGCSDTLCLFRTASGKRTAVAFSSPVKLAKVLGPGQRWVRLSEPAVRQMIAGLDVTGIVIDPAGTTRRPTGRVA